VAGTLIATLGIGLCFLINAGTFVAVIFALMMLDVHALYRSPLAVRAKGQLREGFAYVRRTPALLVPLAMMGLIGMLAYEFQVVLPIVARSSYHGGAQAYGFLTAAMGIGAVIGGLVVASRNATGTRPLVGAASLFGAVILLAAAAPNLWTGCIAMLLVGAGSICFLAIANATLQLAASPTMRGRVMALWSVAFLGSTPIGGPIAGYVSEHLGGRAGLVLGGVACLVAALGGWLFLRRIARGSTAASDAVSEPSEASTHAPVAA
jgi:MFS family permease